jgi:hypothetical protein
VNLEAIASQATSGGTQAQLGLAFRVFFGCCSAILLSAWAFIWLLPEIPLRVQATHAVEAE